MTSGWIKHEASAGRPARYDVTAPKDQEQAALQILDKNGLPARKRAGTQEIFIEGAEIIPTPTQDRARFVAAIEGDIEKKVGGMQTAAHRSASPRSRRSSHPSWRASRPRM